MAAPPSHQPTQVCKLYFDIRKAQCIQGKVATQQPLFARVCTLGQSHSTRCLPASSTVHWSQCLFFSQVRKGCSDAATLHLQLQDEQVLVEILQLSSKQTGSRTLARCAVSLGSLLSCLQMPRRLSNGSLPLRTGDIELQSPHTVSPPLVFVLQYSLDLTISDFNDLHALRPLIDMPSTSQVSDTDGAVRAGRRTPLEKPLNLFEGPSEVPATNGAPHDEPVVPQESVERQQNVHCHECCPRRSAGVPDTPRCADGASVARGSVPSLSPYAPPRTMTHCALPRSATGLAMAKPLHSFCSSRCLPRGQVAGNREPFVVRRVDSNLFRRRDFCAAGSDRNRSSVEFVDRPSRSSGPRRCTSPPPSARPGHLDRSPRKPTKSHELFTDSSSSVSRATEHHAPGARGRQHQATAGAPGSQSVLVTARESGFRAMNDGLAGHRSAEFVSPVRRNMTGGRAASDKNQPPPSSSTKATTAAYHKQGHVSFANDVHADSPVSSESDSSTVIGPITVTTSPPELSSDTRTPPDSPPLSPRDLASASSQPLSAVSTCAGATATRPLEECNSMVRRMRYCGDEVKKLSVELQTRIDSLLTNFCPEQAVTKSSEKQGASADLEELRSSLHTARQERLKQHQTPVVNKPVRIEDSTYWSQRLAEYTGRSHRQLFDETLEKAYLDLYKRAAATS